MYLHTGWPRLSVCKKTLWGRTFVELAEQLSMRFFPPWILIMLRPWRASDRRKSIGGGCHVFKLSFTTGKFLVKTTKRKRKGKMMSALSESNLNPTRLKGHHRVRFEQSWVELSSSLRKRTAQRRTAITESERSDSEWLYRSSSGSESNSSSAIHLQL